MSYPSFYSPFLAGASQAAPVFVSSSTLKTLDLLYYALLIVGVILIIGVIFVFYWEYRKFRRFFEEHKLL